MISASFGLPIDKVQLHAVGLNGVISPKGAGPRILVLIGRIDIFPT
jgi:hypothetical protein